MKSKSKPTLVGVDSQYIDFITLLTAESAEILKGGVPF
jgi:hypothetical protein